MSLLSAEAVTKLEAVRDAILAQPRLYDQYQFFGSAADPCGTACCFAGWVIWLDSPKQFVNMVKSHSVNNFPLNARAVLGVKAAWERGFFGTWVSWSSPYNDLFYEANSAKERARVAANYINFLIERDGPKSKVSA